MPNQPSPLADYNTFTLNQPLQEAVQREGAAWAVDRIARAGAIAGSIEARDHAARTDRHPPVLHRHDAAGRRIDQVERDPSWHWLVNQTVALDLHGITTRAGLPPAHAARAAMVLAWAETSLPTICPISANYAMVPALATGPEVQRAWTGPLTQMDPAKLRFAAASMTERQGGSDIRETTTRAERQADGTYLLTGQKWFVTCPWADVLLVLARAPDGLTCFLAESGHPGYRIERLKDKLGWHGLGVGEVELHDLPAVRVGEEGRGVGTIMRMITFTRLDVMLENAAVLRAGVVRAIHHTRQRRVLGRYLTDHALMRNVLADLALESEAATLAAMRIAGSYDQPQSQLGRIALTLMKYWLSKRATQHAAEAMECLGGNGYVEASGMPRLLRDAAVGSIWEGSGNVAALDVLRAVRTDPRSLQELLDECNHARGGNRHLDAWITTTTDLVTAWASGEDPEWDARMVVEHLALMFQASLMVRFSPNDLADAFCAARLGQRALAYGGLVRGAPVDRILERAVPG